MVNVILKSVWKVRKMENNYQLSRIHNYVKGLMSKEDMYNLEREALEDPFLQDAIDGYKMQNGVDVRQLSLLQQRLASRVEEHASMRNKRFYSWQRLAIGMAAGVMFITVCTLLLLRYMPHHKKVDLKEVLISDALYEYEVKPFVDQSDVLPVGGWPRFYEILNTKYSNHQNYKGPLEISFDVDASNKANNIKISGLDFEEDDELIDIIKNKVSWSGEKAYFLMEVTKISL